MDSGSFFVVFADLSTVTAAPSVTCTIATAFPSVAVVSTDVVAASAEVDALYGIVATADSVSANVGLVGPADLTVVVIEHVTGSTVAGHASDSAAIGPAWASPSPVPPLLALLAAATTVDKTECCWTILGWGILISFLYLSLGFIVVVVVVVVVVYLSVCSFQEIIVGHTKLISVTIPLKCGDCCYIQLS